YLSRQDLGAQQVDELTNQYKAMLEQMGGKVAKTEYWGVKSLTYRIRKNRKAHFTLLNVDAPPAALAEIERQERLNEDVLRYLTIRVDPHEEAPLATPLVAITVAIRLAHHGGRTLLVGVDPDRQVAQHIFVQALLALDFGQGRGRER